MQIVIRNKFSSDGEHLKELRELIYNYPCTAVKQQEPDNISVLFGCGYIPRSGCGYIPRSGCGGTPRSWCDGKPRSGCGYIPRSVQRYCLVRCRGTVPFGAGVLPRSVQRYCLARCRGTVPLGVQLHISPTFAPQTRIKTLETKHPLRRTNPGFLGATALKQSGRADGITWSYRFNLVCRPLQVCHRQTCIKSLLGFLGVRP